MSVKNKMVRSLGVVGLALLAGTALAAPPTDPRPIDPNGTVVFAWAGPPVSLDPHRVGSPADQLYTFLLYDRLTAIGPNFTIVPMLARSWTFEGATMTMKLRDDAKFHDGSPVNAAAVKANIERGKTLDRSTVIQALSAIEAVDVVDDLTVRFRLKAGEGSSLPAILATSAGEMISPKAFADGRNLSTDPRDAGSGPYMVKTFRANEKVLFEPAPVKHWDTKAGKLKSLDVQLVSQAAARLNGLRAGQLDVSQNLGQEIEQAKQLAKGGQFGAYVAQSANVQSLMMQTSRPNLTNHKLRQAIAHGVDRAAISQAAFGGNCVPAAQPVLKDHWAYDPSIETLYPYDPAKARQLVQESGVANPTFEILFGPGTSWEPQANIIQGMMEKIGVKVTLTPMQMSDSIAAFRGGNRDALQLTFPGAPDPSVLVSTLYTGTYMIAPPAERDAVNKLTSRAGNPTLSFPERAALFREIFRRAAEQVWMIPICATTQVWAHKKKVIGMDTADWHFAGLPDLRYLAVVK
jgi:peptide/nickel transport system substrate-binding protein